MIQASVDDYSFELVYKDDAYILNGQTIRPDIRRINDKLWHIIYENHSYNVFVHRVDTASKTAEISINGKRATVSVKSRMQQLLEELGLNFQREEKLDDLRAPMPGLIHSIQVKEGEHVKKGAPLLILEAMKMENVIKSPGEGVVARIHVKEKDSVEKNELLISFE
ncbi:MAG: acetyl-CoA carboxylase biotin carboxyl carrier protein subunit [Bacteroidetes bacterium]|nr:MAG: acetyl-CoA carboxylase biotin carboxyl carrier protein subunit [Bacteroidota bacterium]